MATPDGCPCDAVAAMQEVIHELSERVKTHDEKLADGATQFAIIQKDLDYIRKAIDVASEKKSKLNGSVVSAVINAAATILLGYIAVRLGIQ